MKLVAEDNSTELELRKANDSLDVVRNQLDNSERQVIYQVLRHREGGGSLYCAIGSAEFLVFHTNDHALVSTETSL